MTDVPRTVMPRTSRVTIKQVADAAGYSVATVSRALSGARPVTPEAAVRVAETAARLGYRPNSVARALRTQSTGTIGLVVPDITNPFFPGLVQAVQQHLHEAGLALVLTDSGGDPALEAELIGTLSARQIDGLFVIPCDLDASRDAVEAAARRVPVVQLDRYTAPDLAFVGVDQDDAMRQVIAHLIERGRTRFAFISSRPSISTAHDRTQAFLRYAGAVDPRAAERILPGAFTMQWGRQAAHRLLGDGDRPDAVVCANDLTAAGCLDAMGELGLGVRDVAVTGFDDSLIAAAVRPRLTTVRQRLDVLARDAVTLLRELIADPTARPRRVTSTVELVIRESS